MVDLEIAVQDLAGIRTADALGVGRIELCSALGLGGLTPSSGLIADATAFRPEVHVLIRPRAGGFSYTRAEIDLMLSDIRAAVAAGAHGVVLGVLDSTGMPDLRVLAEFINAAGEAEVTFHRALDVSGDILAAARSLLGSGITRVLTSGGAQTAHAGIATLTELVKILDGEIQVQAAAGINPGNVREIAAAGVAAVHFSAKRAIPGDSRPRTAPGAGVDFGGYDTVDPELAAATVAAIRMG